MAEVKDIKYINKEFSDYRAALIDFAQSYFPNTYNDFSPASPGMMFMEMAAYVGDVLSFYQDTQIQENFIQYAKEKENLYTLAYMLGYRPKVTSASTVTLDIYQLVPSTNNGSGTYVPDFNYALIINEGTQITTQGNSTIQFYVKDKIDFSVSSSLNPTTRSYQHKLDDFVNLCVNFGYEITKEDIIYMMTCGINPQFVKKEYKILVEQNAAYFVKHGTEHQTFKKDG